MCFCDNHAPVYYIVGCLNKHHGSKVDVDDNIDSASDSQGKRSSVNNQPLHLYTDDTHVYDRTSHAPIL